MLSDINGVARMMPSGTVCKDGHLRIGDVILEVRSPSLVCASIPNVYFEHVGTLSLACFLVQVEGVSLDGRKASDVIEELGRAAYFLTVARPHTQLEKSLDTEELPVGEHAGWLHMTRAVLLFIGGLTATGYSHCCESLPLRLASKITHVYSSGPAPSAQTLSQMLGQPRERDPDIV